MKESVFRGQINKLLRRLWYWPMAQVDASVCHECGALIRPPSGRPDLLCLNPAEPSIVAEAKMFTHKAGDEWERASFAFSRITPQQRTWLTNFQGDGVAGRIRTGANYGHWVSSYIAISTPHGRAGAKEKPRLAWLVPWPQWLTKESRVLEVRKSLPLVALRKKDKGLGAVDLLEPWALIWEKGGWAVKIDHPLWVAELRDLDEFSQKWHKETTK